MSAGIQNAVSAKAAINLRKEKRMNSRILEKWQIIKQVIDGSKPLKHASSELGVCYRQAIRIKKSVITNGIRGLVHGNTGKKPANTIEPDVQALILRLSKDDYSGLNDALFTEQILKNHGISVSRETVRKIRRSAGIKPVFPKRCANAKQDIAKPREGMKIIWYAMNQKWFGESSCPSCLLAVLDKATFRCLAAGFFPYEESSAYFLLLKKIILSYGVPHTIVQHNNSILKRQTNDWSIEEELMGYQNPTQVQRALQELNIKAVYISSKRQKCKIEQIFNQLYEAINSEIIKENISDINQGNILLNHFIPDFNRNYAIEPSSVIRAWKPAPTAAEVDKICSFYYETTVKPDNTVAVGDVKIKLHPKWGRLANSGSKVEARRLLDGSWKIYYQKKLIAEHAPAGNNKVKKRKPALNTARGRSQEARL